MIRVMLAAATNGDNLNYPLLASPKLDGVRAVIYNGIVMSRNGKPIPNDYVQRLLGKKKYDGLDGELIVGDATADDVYRKTMSGVMSGDEEPQFTFNVFDDYRIGGPFHARLERTHRAVETHVAASRRIAAVMRPLLHLEVNSHEELLLVEQQWLADGYEGVMLRAPSGEYKQGRSTALEGGLLKLKRFADEEAVIVGYEELQRNTNEKTKDELGRAKRSSHKAGKVAAGTLGAITCKSPSFRELFSIGTGFDQQLRDELWAARGKLKGRIVKYKHMPVGAKDRPRFPVFLGFRHPADA